jgi:hypothetical protein
MIGDILFCQAFVEFYDAEFNYAFFGLCTAVIAVLPSAIKNNELHPVTDDPRTYTFMTSSNKSQK